MGIGNRIKTKREELGLSQGELAKKLGYSSRSAIAKIEREASDIPYTKIKEFADALNTSINYLVNGEKYYLNKDTEEIAKAAYENKDIKTLNILARKISAKKLKAFINLMQEMDNEEK